MLLLALLMRATCCVIATWSRWLQSCYTSCNPPILSSLVSAADAKVTRAETSPPTPERSRREASYGYTKPATAQGLREARLARSGTLPSPSSADRRQGSPPRSISSQHGVSPPWSSGAHGAPDTPVRVMFEVLDEAARGPAGAPALVKVQLRPPEAQTTSPSLVAQTAETMRARFRTMRQDLEKSDPGLLNA